MWKGPMDFKRNKKKHAMTKTAFPLFKHIKMTMCWWKCRKVFIYYWTTIIEQKMNHTQSDFQQFFNQTWITPKAIFVLAVPSPAKIYLYSKCEKSCNYHNVICLFYWPRNSITRLLEKRFDKCFGNMVLIATCNSPSPSIHCIPAKKHVLMLTVLNCNS